MKIEIYVSEKLLSKLVEKYERTDDISCYEDYKDYKRLSDDDMCNRYYVMNSEGDDVERFCLLGELDDYNNLIVDEDLIDEDLIDDE